MVPNHTHLGTIEYIYHYHACTLHVVISRYFILASYRVEFLYRTIALESTSQKQLASYIAIDVVLLLVQ